MSNDTCPQCNQPGLFGYRDKQTGEMTWYCTAHRKLVPEIMETGTDRNLGLATARQIDGGCR